ncbi:MAG: M3 family oligoendopeptidase [Actinomycetota bacterium]
MAMNEEANSVVWDLGPLVYDKGSDGVEELLDQADELAEELSKARGQLGSFNSDRLAAFMGRLGELEDLTGRAGNYAQLRYSADTNDPKNGALVQRVQERSTAIGTKLLFFDLEWAALPDDKIRELLAPPELDPYRHHLLSARRYRDYLLTEPEEKIMTEKSVSGRSAWTRLFSELTSALEVDLEGEKKPLEEGLSLLSSPEREVRRDAAAAITEAFEPGLKTRTFLFNTILSDKAIDDRLRGYEHWLKSRNLANEASDESVEALVTAVRDRYDIPRRWYKLKARIWGINRIADYDRVASLAETDERIGFKDAKRIVLDSYGSFSSELADLARRFFDEAWIDAPVRPGKRPGAFCAYTVPSHHPYVFLNFTARRTDVLTMAHELGHGLHGALARKQGVFHQWTPLTLAETASVFGETVTNKRLLEMAETPESRLSLLADNVERAIATVFRQIAMNRFEDAVHNARRDSGEISPDRFGELWIDTQVDMLGDSVELTEGYKTWWSYIPHFIGTPGYVYAYAYGQLLALSVYKRYEEQGPSFVPSYIELLSAGGSMPPEELGKIVDCDLADPAFWDGGLAIVDEQLSAAEAAAKEVHNL